MNEDYTRWALGCLVRELGREFEEIDKRHGSFYEYSAMACDIKDHVKPVEDARGYRAQWLLHHLMGFVNNHVPNSSLSSVCQELNRRLKQDQEERGVFDTAL